MKNSSLSETNQSQVVQNLEIVLGCWCFTPNTKLLVEILRKSRLKVYFILSLQNC